jgi:hypothetical protein
MAKRKPCGKPVKDDLGQYACGYERAPGLQQCRWHWLMRQSAAIQKEWAAKRLAAYDEGGFPRRDRRPKSEWLPGTRWCSGCQDYVPLFYCQGSRCRSCNSEAAHGARIEKVYGITPEEYAALFKLQDGRCYICRRQTKKRLAVDHDHKTGQVRGLLCADNDRGCNHAILGNIRDLAMAKRIVEYLEYPPYERLQVQRGYEEAKNRVQASQNVAQEPRAGNPWGPPPF